MGTLTKITWRLTSRKSFMLAKLQTRNIEIAKRLKDGKDITGLLPDHMKPDAPVVDVDGAVVDKRTISIRSARKLVISLLHRWLKLILEMMALPPMLHHHNLEFLWLFQAIWAFCTPCGGGLTMETVFRHVNAEATRAPLVVAEGSWRARFRVNHKRN